MFEGLFQPLHLLVIFVIAMLIFGPKKLADLGKGLGQGIREFKDAVKDGDHQSTSTPTSVEKEHEKTNVG
jgi:sec-independent protein translocase protein TatA